MKRIFPQILFIFLLSTNFFAQGEERKAELFQEFDYVGMEELAARLDNLTMRLQGNPSEKAVIKIYGGEKKTFSSPYIHGAIIKAYLKNNRAIPAERFSIQFCNIRKGAIKTQFFVVAGNEEIEPCEENLTVPEKTVLFESLYFYYDAEFSSKKPLEETIIDVVGPGEQEYSQMAQAVLLKLLNQSPDSKIYLIGYLGTNLQWIYRDGKGKEIRKLDKPKALNKIFAQIEKELVNSGIAASRIVKINGGYREPVKNVELWFVPKGGEIPEPSPDYFPKKK